MKKTRRFAALLAAVMCVSGMGAMSAFAADLSIDDGLKYVDDNDHSVVEKTTDFDLKFNQNTIYDGKDESKTATWIIGIEADELTWDITKTVTFAGTSHACDLLQTGEN